MAINQAKTIENLYYRGMAGTLERFCPVIIRLIHIISIASLLLAFVTV